MRSIGESLFPRRYGIPADAIWRRHLLFVVILSTLGLTGVLALIYLVLFFFDATPTRVSLLVSNLVWAVLLAVLWMVSLRGHIRWAAYLYLLLLVIAASATFAIEELDRVLILYALPTVLASFLLRPACAILFAGLSTLGYSVVYLVSRTTMDYNVVSVPALFGLAFLAWLIAGRLEGVLGTAAQEIAERKQVEAILQESEQQFKTLAEQSPSMIFINQMGRVVYANQRCTEIMGYTREEFYAPGFDFLDLIAEEHRQLVRQNFRRHAAGEEIAPYEYTLVTRGGRYIPAIHATRLIDYAGQKAILGIITDVTERVQREQEMRWRAEMLAALHETALDLAAQRELPDLLHAIVERAVYLLGGKGGGIYLYRPSSDDLELVLSYNMGADYTGTVLQRGEGLSGRVLEGGRPMVVSDYGQWEGQAAAYQQAGFAACIAVPISWGDRFLGVLTVLEDAPRRFSEEDTHLLERFAPLAGAALEQTRLLEEVRVRWQEAETLRQAGAAVSEVLSLDQRLDRILEQLARVVRYDSASVQLLRRGDSGDYLEIVGGRGFPDPEAVIGLTFPVPGDNPNTVVVERREPIHLPDARTPYPSFRGSPHEHIRSWMGVPLVVQERVVGLLAVDSIDLESFDSEQLRLVMPFADQVAAALENARLYEDLQQQMARLKETQAQLIQSAKLAAVGQLAAGVAHELNNPLAIILGFSEMLLEELEAGAPFRRDLETIVGEARRVRDIVSNLLDLSRQSKPRRCAADINQILRDTLVLIRYHLDQNGVTVEESYAAGLSPLSLDPGQMRQVFLNLITNAIQAMPDGGVLRLESARSGDGVVVSIADTGEGMPAAIQERLFDPFFTTRRSGTGLGLPVSLGIVQEHGGQITVASEQGRGSVFRVWLPHEGFREPAGRGPTVVDKTGSADS